jgi:hypothetical protein
MGADCVITATPWPVRLTNDRQETTFPAQSANARLVAVVNQLNSLSQNLWLPPITAAVAAQTQTVPATANTASPPTTGTTIARYPGYLPVIRDAATDGVAWWTAVAGATGPGTLTLNYARMETNTVRTLDGSQVIAGPPTSASAGYVITLADWKAVNASGVASEYIVTGATNVWGLQGSALRLYGDVTTTASPEFNAIHTTSSNMLNARNDPSEEVLSTVDVQSGRRTGPTGGPSSASWDPYAHVFSPTDVAQIAHGGKTNNYRVTKSAHRLTATSWQTTHTLDKYIAAAALP